MKTRKPIAILAATAVAGLGLTAFATPATADTTVTVSNILQVSPSSIAGTSVTLNNRSNQALAVVSLFLSDGDEACSVNKNPFCSVQQGGTATFDIAPGASGALVRLTDPANPNNIFATFTVTYPDAPPTGSTPAPVIQQFEKPATGTCDEAQPEGLNWGGASSGGWGESWARWANAGQGGPVCTRTLEYNNSTATWQVQ